MVRAAKGHMSLILRQAGLDVRLSRTATELASYVGAMANLVRAAASADGAP